MKRVSNQPPKKKILGGLALLTVCVCIALIYYGAFGHIELFRRIERISLDLRFRMRPDVPVSGRIGTIDIDEKTIRRAGTWPISRRFYADFLYVLRAWDASLLIFDIFFPDTGPMDIDPASLAEAGRIASQGITEHTLPQAEAILKRMTRHPDDDLIAALGETDMTVLAQTFNLANVGLFPDIRGIEARTEDEKRNSPPHHRISMAMAERFSVPAALSNRDMRRVASAYGVEPPHPMFLEKATGLGYAQIIEDRDGVVRNYPLMLRYDGRLYPSTVLMALGLLSKTPLNAIRIEPGRRIVLPGSTHGDPPGPFLIPVDEQLQMTVNWTGDYPDTFVHFPGTLLLRYRAEMIIRERIRAFGDDWRSLIASGVQPLADETIERKLLPPEDAWPMSQYLFLARLAELSHVIGIPSRDVFVQFLGSGDKPELRAALPEIWDQINANRRMADMLQTDPSISWETAQAALETEDLRKAAHRHAFDLLRYFVGRGKALSECGPLYFFPPDEMKIGRGRAVQQTSPLDLTGKILFIGLTATGTHDIKPMPYSAYYPMVGLHANAMNTILTGRHIHELPEYAVLLLMLCFGLLAWFVIPRMRPYPAAVFVFCAALVHSLAAKAALDHAGLALPLLAPILTLLTAYLVITVSKYVNERKERRRTRGIFSTYLSPDVVDMVLRQPDMLHLGGLRREMSVYFSDLSGFTAISENLSPEDLVAIMNQYFEAMTRIILKYNGTLDKYIGDSIMAFWNAPSDQSDHARLACLAALECRDHLVHVLQPLWREAGKPILTMRAGINTGPMIVGNMGSDTRMNYTVMGDAVNLGARLEPANKAYGTTLMASEFTREQAGKGVVFRELDLLRVVGKARPIRVYEITAREGEETEVLRRMLDIHHQGLAAYRNREWRKAIDLFTEILKHAPEDGPAKTYLDRCHRFEESPPPDDWDGVWTQKGK